MERKSMGASSANNPSHGMQTKFAPYNKCQSQLGEVQHTQSGDWRTNERTCHASHACKSTWYVQTDSPSDNVLAQSEFRGLILIGVRRKKMEKHAPPYSTYMCTCCCSLVLRTYVLTHSICWTTGSPTHAFTGRYILRPTIL